MFGLENCRLFVHSSGVCLPGTAFVSAMWRMHIAAGEGKAFGCLMSIMGLSKKPSRACMYAYKSPHATPYSCVNSLDSYSQGQLFKVERNFYRTQENYQALLW